MLILEKHVSQLLVTCTSIYMYSYCCYYKLKTSKWISLKLINLKDHVLR